jgi:ubiquinone/menaquinone biosynthesis C-methylase UbiE
MLRRPTLELLDTDSGTAREVADSLLDLRWFNHWFGGIATMRQMLQTVVRRTGARKLAVLEVGSGEGYIPQVLRREFSDSGIELSVTLLDRVPTHLPANGSFRKVAGEALTLPFRDLSLDLVCCSLFVHHLDPEAAVTFIREALRVSRTAVLIHDLIRNPVHLALAYAGVPLYRSRVTRNDAPASVWQAYTVQEMKDFAQTAGAIQVEAHHQFMFRMGVIAWKKHFSIS